MKRIVISLLVLIFIVQLVNAAEVCVVVDYGGVGEAETDSKCISIDEGKNGYDVLEATGFDVLWSPVSMWGQMVCKINDVGTDVNTQTGSCEYSGDFWNFVLMDGTKWGHSPVGLNGGDECWNRDFSWSDWSKVVHYCVKDGDFLGFAFGEEGAEPNMFKVNITKIYVDGEKQSESKTRGGKIIDVFPESKVELKIELENLYHSSTDIEIRDVSIEATIEEIDDGEDIEEDVNEFDLDADRKTTKELVFTIPLEVEAKDRLLRIEVKAKDDAGIKYEIEFTYDLEVEKEDHKLKILKAELDKDSYRCGENALLEFSILNIGDKDEDVDLEIVNEDLGIDINKDFELSNDVYEESSRYNSKFNIWIPDNLDKGAYPVTITASYGREEEIRNVDLVISECEGAKESEEVMGVQTGRTSKKVEINESKEAELGEVGIIKERITENLPLILGIVLVVLVVVIIGLFLMFWVLRK